MRKTIAAVTAFGVVLAGGCSYEKRVDAEKYPASAAAESFHSQPDRQQKTANETCRLLRVIRMKLGEYDTPAFLPGKYGVELRYVPTKMMEDALDLREFQEDKMGNTPQSKAAKLVLQAAQDVDFAAVNAYVWNGDGEVVPPLKVEPSNEDMDMYFDVARISVRDAYNANCPSQTFGAAT